VAKIEFTEAKASLDRAWTWDTAADLVSAQGLLHYDTIGLSDNPNYLPITNDDNVHTDVHKGAHGPTVTATATLSYDGLINEAIAAVMGTASAPVEQTGGQGDYLHNIDLAASNLDIFQTIAWKVESDQVIEIPSVKWQEFTIRGESNNFPTATTSGLAGSTVYSAASGASIVNSYTTLDGLSLPTDPPKFALCGGSSLYCRKNTEAGGALSSSDDLEILSWEFKLSRPLDPSHPFRGANTQYPTQPTQLQAYDATLTLTFDHIDDADHDPRKDRDDQTAQKCEIFFDGAVIGAGENRSYKFQFPSMKAIDSPGYGPQRDQRLAPSVTYRLFKAAAAPTGMTGVTVPRIALINTRSALLL
jgi:hypothetical protein